VACGVDGADVGQDFGVVLECTQSVAEEPDRLARRLQVRICGRRVSGI
jgi:hypothetical protein